MRSSLNFIFLLCLGLIINSLNAQSSQSTIQVSDTLAINFENLYELKSVSIIPFSERIELRNRILKKSEYEISYESASFRLSDSLAYSIFDTLIISYKTVRLSLKKEYKRRSLVIRYDEIYNDSIRVIQAEEGGLTTESIFGSDIQKSGTLVRGFTVGTTRDFTLSSGLRLQLSGKLSEDIEIVAALTDENTPIQPEGNTERLDELDKVFIEVRHPNVIGTFGDYDLNERIGEFGVINRKLQGLKGQFFYKENSSVVAIASSKGKFNSQQINGIDGVQGPYRLSGANNERDIIIIAGSEKVFIDGEEMTRGENNDYTIEYSNAQITFTPKRLITSASRISVDFEYTDRKFKRNTFAGNIKTSFFDDRLNVSFNYFREGDDEDSPVDFSLSDEDKKILSTAGDDRNKAVRSGVSLAEPDSLGNVKGIYVEVDSTLNGDPFKYYVYNPGDPNAIYNVIFSFVGDGEGDYIKESLGRYRFVGSGNGGYLPVQFLPLPELRQMGNVVVDAEPWKDVFLQMELAGSLWDKNKLSENDENDNSGYARNINLQIKPKEVEIGGLSLGKIGLTYKDRFVEDRFTSLDRFNTVEFGRDYNVQNNLIEDEVLREVGLNLVPFDQLKINSKYGYLSKGSRFKTNRYLSDVNLFEKDSYDVKYKLDYAETKNNNLNSNWLKQSAVASYKFGYFKPGADFYFEKKKDKFTNKDSLLSTSLQYVETAPFLKIIDLFGFDASLKYSIRDESFPIDGDLIKESRAATQKYELNYKGIREFNTDLNLTLRKKEYTDKFKERGFLDNETVLIRSQSRFNFWERLLDGDLFYEVSSQRSARLEKVFVRVPQGTGNYIYLGDLNNNGIAEENEFELVAFDGDFIVTTIPTDELFPVIDLKTSTRWKIEFDKFSKSQNWFTSIIKPVSTETFVRIEENSRIEDTKQIYLLNFNKFMNDSTTIRGSNLFQQDIHLYRNQTDFSLRFRYIQRNNMNQYSAGIERGYFRERSIRVRFKLVQEVTNQTEYINQNDNVAAPATSNRARIVDNDEVNTDFSYRPIRQLEVGFKFGVGRSQDNLPQNPTIIDINSQTLRANLSFAGKGRLRLEVERSELTANTQDNTIPFEITRGKRIGKNYFWRLNFDYRFANNLQSTVSYDGRLQGGGKAIHTLRAEARAYF